jgi:hypothetical protein
MDRQAQSVFDGVEPSRQTSRPSLILQVDHILYEWFNTFHQFFFSNTLNLEGY